MKAARIHQYGGPEVLVYEDVPTPEPSEGQVLVAVRAASLNRVDIAVREHRFPTPKLPPRILGTDGAGVVERLGPGVAGAQVGQEVMFTGLGIGMEGSHAEYTVVHEVQLVPKPATLSFEEAAAMGQVFPTAYYALDRRARLQQGETVLIHGAAGGVGSAAVQLAAAFGARTFATVSSEKDAQRVRELGAEEIIIRGQADVTAEIRQRTGGRGVDVILDVAAAENMLADIAALAKGGRIVAVGAGKQNEASVAVDAAGAIDASILFMSTHNAGRAGVAEMMRKIAQLVESGAVRPVIGAVLPLAEARRAHELLAGDHFGKIVLVP